MPDGLLCRHVPVSRYTYSIKGCVATVPNCTTSFSVGAPGFVVGNTLEVVPRGTTADDCKRTCLLDPRCVAYHYRADRQNCGLKTSAASIEASENWQKKHTHFKKVSMCTSPVTSTSTYSTTSTVTASSSSTSTLPARETCTFTPRGWGFVEGNTLASARGATLEECKSLCRGDPACVAFHYGAANRQCGTKSSASRPSTGKWRNQFAIYAKVCNYKN